MQLKWIKLFLILYVLNTSLLVKSQTILLNELSNMQLPQRSVALTSMQRMFSTAIGDTILFVPQNFTDAEKNCTVFRYIVSQNKSDSLQFRLDKNLKKIFKYSCHSIYSTSTYFFVFTSEAIAVFKYVKNTLEFVKAIPNEKSFARAKALDDSNLLLYVNYNFHPFDEEDKHVWGKLNLQTLTIESVKKMPDDNVMFAYFVNDWISTYKGLIAYANTSDYKITLYDKNFNKTDSIVSNVLDSNKLIISKFKFQNNYSKDDITVLMKEDANSLKRIQKITLLDSTHVLVILKLPKTQNCQLDTWKKTNGVWKVYATETIDSFYQKGKAYTKDNTPRFGLFGNANGVSYLSKGVFSIIYFPYLKAIETPNYETERDYNGAINELVKTNQLFFGVKQYVVKMD
jgi:hypothetical protein